MYFFTLTSCAHSIEEVVACIQGKIFVFSKFLLQSPVFYFFNFFSYFWCKIVKIPVKSSLDSHVYLNKNRLLLLNMG